MSSLALSLTKLLCVLIFLLCQKVVLQQRGDADTFAENLFYQVLCVHYLDYGKVFHSNLERLYSTPDFFVALIEVLSSVLYQVPKTSMVACLSRFFSNTPCSGF